MEGEDIAVLYLRPERLPLPLRGPPPLINAGGKNGAQPPWLSPWESWHGEAVTERAVPAAAGDSPCRFAALPPHKCGGQGLSLRCTFQPGNDFRPSFVRKSAGS